MVHLQRVSLLLLACSALVALAAEPLVFKIERTDVTLNIDNAVNTSALVYGSDIIDGSVVIKGSVCSLPLPAAYATTEAFLTALLGQVRIITRFLELRGPFSCLTNFGFLSNLESVLAQGSDVGLSMTFVPPNDLGALQYIGLSSLKTVVGAVVVQYTTSAIGPCSGSCMSQPPGSFLGFNFAALMPGTTAVQAGSITINNFDGRQLQAAVPTTSRTVPACHTSCGGFCTKPNDPTACQTICDDSCGDRGCTPTGCCPAECKGGCDDQGKCFSCQPGLLLAPDGSCGTSCPAGYSAFGWFFEPLPFCDNAFDRVMQPYVCVSQCPDLTVNASGVCEIFCPGALKPVNGQCPPMPPELAEFKVCPGIFDLTQTCQLDLIENSDCDTLAGSILISPTSSIGQANDIQMQVLRKLRRVAGRVYVFQSFLTSLGFLENTVRIDGQHLDETRPIIELQSNLMLRVLELTSLRALGPGSVKLQDNPFLCLHETVDWERLNPDFDRTTDLDIGFTEAFFDDNKDPFFINMQYSQFEDAIKHPVTCNGFKCDDFCLDSHGNGSCWNTLPDSCQRCPEGQLLEEGVCRSTCSPGFYQDDWRCRRCHPSCLSCFGPDSTECTSCTGSFLLKGSACVVSCGLANYPASNGSCLACNSACLECSGPTADECQECKPGHFKQPASSSCQAGCPPGYYADPVTSTCVSCSTDCVKCFSADACRICGGSKFLDLDSDACTATCPTEFFGAGTGTEGRQCRRCRTCSAGVEYAVQNCTTESDRRCEPCSPCNFPSEFRFQQCTPDKDTVCRPVRQCNLATTFIAAQPTPTSDRVCQPLRQCASDEYVSQAPTQTSNRVCSKISNCTAGFFEISAPTDSSNRVCSPCSECAEGFEAQGGCQGTNDTVCVRSPGCAGLPCENGGTCTDISTEPFYSCACPASTTGPTCTVGASSSDSTATVIGAAAGAGGGLLVIVVALIFILGARRRSGRTKPRKMPDEWEIPREWVTVGEEIGGGNFGSVSRGLLRNPEHDESIRAKQVAVKQLKEGATENVIADFDSEMALMKDIGRHRNVLSLIGACTLDDPVLLVLEFAKHGDLRSYLMEARATDDMPAQLKPEMLIDFGTQIACGMAFLAEHNIVHRDLAARNILVAEDSESLDTVNKRKTKVLGKFRQRPLLKVSDFGLARRPVNDFYLKQNNNDQLPIKWMAMEALEDRVYTTKSDVWAFGIVLWEIETFGKMPYPDIPNHQVLKLLKDGYRMPKPPKCPPQMHEIMTRCWHRKPEDRPNFSELQSDLIHLTGKDERVYLDPHAGERPRPMHPDAVITTETTDDGYMMPVIGLTSNDESAIMENKGFRPSSGDVTLDIDETALGGHLYDRGDNPEAINGGDDHLYDRGDNPGAVDESEGHVYDRGDNPLAIEEEVEEGAAYDLADSEGANTPADPGSYIQVEGRSSVPEDEVFGDFGEQGVYDNMDDSGQQMTGSKKR